MSELSGYPSKQDREKQLAYGNRKKHFTFKAVVAVANIALTAQRLLSWVGVLVCVPGPMRSVSN